jgi:DNA-directed RNA polymerase subunit alpha
MKMPFGEVLATLNDMTKPSAPILASDVSIRAFNCLQNEGIKTYEELAARSQAEILRLPNMGRKALNELKELLHARGLSFDGQ